MQYLVVQTWGIGDFILTIPLLRAIQETQAGSIDVVVGSKAVEKIARRLEFVRNVYVMKKRDLLSTLVFFFRLRSQPYDVCIVSTELSPHYAEIVLFLGVAKRVMNDRLFSKSLYPFTYTRQFQPTESRVHSNLALLQSSQPEINVSRIHEQIKIDISDEVKVENQHLLDAVKECQHRVLIHPGCDSNRDFSRLPTAKFIRIIQLLLAKCPDVGIFILFGPDEELLLSEYQELRASNRVKIVKDRSIDQVLGLLDNCDLTITSDSGIGHFSTLVQTPIITIAGPTCIERTQPLSTSSYIVRTDVPLPCMPCYYQKSLYGKCQDMQCFKTFAEEKVIDLAMQILFQKKSVMAGKTSSDVPSSKNMPQTDEYL